MNFFTLFYKNILFFSVLLLVSFFTMNIINPIHEHLSAISIYALELVAVFIILGFVALKFKKPYIMLVCFIGSISLCNHLEKRDIVLEEHINKETDFMSVKSSNQPNIINTTLKNINSKNQGKTNISHFSIHKSYSLED